MEGSPTPLVWSQLSPLKDHQPSPSPWEELQGAGRAVSKARGPWLEKPSTFLVSWRGLRMVLSAPRVPPQSLDRTQSVSSSPGGFLNPNSGSYCTFPPVLCCCPSRLPSLNTPWLSLPHCSLECSSPGNQSTCPPRTKTGIHQGCQSRACRTAVQNDWCWLVHPRFISPFSRVLNQMALHRWSVVLDI